MISFHQQREQSTRFPSRFLSFCMIERLPLCIGSVLCSILKFQTTFHRHHIKRLVIGWVLTLSSMARDIFSGWASVRVYLVDGPVAAYSSPALVQLQLARYKSFATVQQQVQQKNHDVIVITIHTDRLFTESHLKRSVVVVFLVESCFVHLWRVYVYFIL
jgi:hypothetical protein